MLYKVRHAFSMLELVFVITILGIVSSIGAEIIAKVYGGYIIERAQHRASIKTELAATQIANRLANAIPGTIVRKSDLNSGGEDITDAPPAGTNHVLQWVGADTDSFNAITSAANRLPGWSGYCDVDNILTTHTVLSTPRSNLTLTNTIKGNLDFTSSAQIYFPLRSGLTSATVAAVGLAGSTITLAANPAPIDNIAEHYKLALTSYALEAQDDGDLFLHYNFAPTVGAAVGGKAQLLLRNVSVFRFRGDGRTIRFKLCVDEPIGDGKITICKEKAVF